MLSRCVTGGSERAGERNSGDPGVSPGNASTLMFGELHVCRCCNAGQLRRKDGDAHLQKDTGKSGNLVGQMSERWIGGKVVDFY